MNKPTPSAPIGSIGQTIDGLRIAVAVKWNDPSYPNCSPTTITSVQSERASSTRYPMHITRQLIVTVGALRIVDEAWNAESRAVAIKKLELMLHAANPAHPHAELMIDFRRFLGEVGL